MQNWGWPPTRTWNRTKRGWRPSNTNTTKHELASTSEEGEKKLQAGCKFYSELYEILGSGDAFNPDRMTISASSVIPGKSKSSETAGNVVGETDGSVSPTVNLETSDSQPLTSTLDNSPPQPEATCEKNKSKKGPGKTPTERKRKTPSRDDQDEDPFMNGLICDMWRLSMEKQSECVEKSMELRLLLMDFLSKWNGHLTFQVTSFVLVELFGSYWQRPPFGVKTAEAYFKA